VCCDCNSKSDVDMLQCYSFANIGRGNKHGMIRRIILFMYLCDVDGCICPGEASMHKTRLVFRHGVSARVS
jgi:hypothetical protein